MRSSTGSVPPGTLGSLERAQHEAHGVDLADAGEEAVAEALPDVDPATSPAMSTNSTVAATTLRLFDISASAVRRWSGTCATPTLVSVVVNG